MNPLYSNPNQFYRSQLTFPFRQMIESIRGVYIKQKFSLLQVVSWRRQPRKYYIYEMDVSGRQTGCKLFKVNEVVDSCGCCYSCCSCGVKMITVKNLHNDENECLEFVPPKCCICMTPCCAPNYEVFYTEEGRRELLGGIGYTKGSLSHSFIATNEQKFKAHELSALRCQCAICCYGNPCCGDCCPTAKFSMERGETKIPLEMIKTEKTRSTKRCLSTANNFSLPFPEGSSFKERALLIATTILVDLRLFEAKVICCR